jgi:hypothetical protein
MALTVFTTSDRRDVCETEDFFRYFFITALVSLPNR